MSEKSPNGTRDDLDRAITQMVRKGKAARGVPAPGPGDVSDEVLLRVLEGTATPEEQERVEAAGGAWTRDRLAILQEAMTETGHAPGPTERAARYVFTLARGALELVRSATEPVVVPQVAWATRKGAPAKETEPYFELAQGFGEMDARIKLEQASATSVDVALALRAGGQPVAAARVVLKRGGRKVESVPVDGRGQATFRGVAPGKYEIDILRRGERVGRVDLELL